jgi:hypothetical protein
MYFRRVLKHHFCEHSRDVFSNPIYYFLCQIRDYSELFYNLIGRTFIR